MFPLLSETEFDAEMMVHILNLKDSALFQIQYILLNTRVSRNLQCTVFLLVLDINRINGNFFYNNFFYNNNYLLTKLYSD